MNKILVVVDYQNDFVTGSLGTPEAREIAIKLKEKIEEYRKNDDFIVFTRDMHDKFYLKTLEGEYLPIEHCLKNTPGSKLVFNSLFEREMKRKEFVIEKHQFGSTHLGDRLINTMVENKDFYMPVEFIGVCTGICVLSNALIAKAMLPETRITVDASCCACVTPESHKNALAAMKLCQIDIINEDN